MATIRAATSEGSSRGRFLGTLAQEPAHLGGHVGGPPSELAARGAMGWTVAMQGRQGKAVKARRTERREGTPLAFAACRATVSPTRFPEFTSVEDERRHRKQRLAAGFRLFGTFGFDEGVAGHITARDPELTDHFWVNPFAMNFKHIRVRDLILVNDHGEVVEGNWPVNQAAFCIHSAVHQARPDVVAAAHSHSVYGKTFSALSVRSSRSPRTPAPSSRTTRSSTTTPASSSTPRRARRSPTPSASTRRPSSATTAC